MPDGYEFTPVIVSSTRPVELDLRQVYICSFEILRNMFGSGNWTPGTFGIIVVDESHMIKSPHAKRAQVCHPIAAVTLL